MWTSVVVLAVSAVLLAAAIVVARPALADRKAGSDGGLVTDGRGTSAEPLLRSEPDGHGGLNVFSTNGGEVLFSMVPASVTAPRWAVAAV